MPPKARKDAEKVAVDKTFGMKNKNKSKAVQKYIKQITNNVMGAPKGGKEEADRKAKTEKEAENKKKALMASLFNLQTDKKGREYDPIAKKAAKAKEEQDIAAGKKLKEDVRKEIIEGIANSIRLTNQKGVRMSELGGHPIIQLLKTKHLESFKIIQLLSFIKANDKIFWVDDVESSNPMIRMLEDVEAECGPDERPIEEIIEERRMALPPGGTPVTLDTFKAWREKRKAMEDEKAAEARNAIIKKSGKNPITGLSGRDLFTFDASLFVDDEGAAGADELDERNSVNSDDEEKPADDDSDEEEEEDEGKGSGAAGSGDAKGVEINAELFQDGDVPDDLDDLDDDED